MQSERRKYFKLVAISDPEWLFAEFQKGIVRFGWSGPGSDLRVIKQKEANQRTPAERTTWRYTRFLVERIHPGDRLVLQFERPLRRFLIAEVTEEGYDFASPAQSDFNHMLHCKPLTPDYIRINAKFVRASLRHDLCKRNQYYEIYPVTSVNLLDRIVKERLWEGSDPELTRTHEDELDEMYEAAKKSAIREISSRWKGTDFEKFCATLCNVIPNVAVKERRDTHKGWDMLLQISNPVTNAVLVDDVPVQCKNYSGKVTDDRPIDDLARCIKNSRKDIAYLFILGDLSEEFRARLDKCCEALADDLGKEITFEVVDQDMIAELYLRHASCVLAGTDTAE